MLTTLFFNKKKIGEHKNDTIKKNKRNAIHSGININKINKKLH